MVVVDEVLHADQERVNNPQPHHREVLRIVPGKMETGFVLGDRVFLSSYILFPGLNFFSGPKYRRLIYQQPGF